ILRTEIYATACIIGGILHTGALSLGVGAQHAMLLGLFSTLGIRLAAIRWNLKLPTFRID
ncbi:MAG: TRIC cation channel family protein, partial [Plesiomonas shigelloides]